MRTVLLLPLPVLALSSWAGALPADATVPATKFNGAVASQAGTSLGVGSAISGEFAYDTTTGAYRSLPLVAS